MEPKFFDLRKLTLNVKLLIYETQGCIHGGSRKKSTGLLTTLEALVALEGSCQGDHEHLEWGHVRASDGSIVFDTSKEAAYPRLLCATYKQPRGRKIPPLISEIDETKIIRYRHSDEPKLDDKNCLTADLYGVPAGSKLLRKASVDKGDFNIHKTMWVFGIFSDPVAFLTIAKEVQHPFDSFRAVSPEVLKVVCNILSKHPLQIMKRRLEKLQHWRLCAKELSEDNKKRFNNTDSGGAAVLKGKHLSLLQKI